LIGQAVGHDFGGNEQQQFCFVVFVNIPSEQAAEIRNIPQEWNLIFAFNGFYGEYTTQYNSLSISYENFRGQLCYIQGRNTSSQVKLSNRILIDDEIHDDAVIRSNLRSNIQLQNSFFK